MKGKQLSSFIPFPEEHSRTPVATKVEESLELLKNYIPENLQAEIIKEDFNLNSFLMGNLPRLSPFDLPYIPSGAKLIKIPENEVQRIREQRSYDLTRWNTPERFLFRLELAKSHPFVAPIPGRSRVMDRQEAHGKVSSFDDLKITAPEPVNGRQSRKRIDSGIESVIMGQARIPFALGSVPDVGSFLSYATIAMSNGMAFVSRDKLLSSIEKQAELVQEIINYLKTVELPKDLNPKAEHLKKFAEISGINTKKLDKEKLTKQYFIALRNSWINNIGAAIEADFDGVNTKSKAIKRAEALYAVGCRMFRVYSPEGGMEIVHTTRELKRIFAGKDVKVISGQIMDAKTALRSEQAGADALIIGVAGGSQCTTSVNANIPVNTPNLLYDLRRGEIGIPVGVEGGGVGTNIITAFALGASFVSKPGELGRSWEGLGGKYVFELNGEYYMVYGGEASVSAKWFKDSVDAVGRPKYVEGETGVRDLGTSVPSMTSEISRLRGQLAIGLVFQRAESIAVLHARDADNIIEVTQSAGALSQAYAK